MSKNGPEQLSDINIQDLIQVVITTLALKALQGLRDPAPTMDDVRMAIDSVIAMGEAVGPRLGSNEYKDIQSTISSLQLAYAQAAGEEQGGQLSNEDC